MRKLLKNNTVLHQLGAMKAFSIEPGRSLGNFCFNNIFIDKKNAFCKFF